MESNASRLIIVDDKRPSSQAAVLAALGGPGQKPSLLQAWQTPDWQTGGAVNRIDAICAAVADAIAAIGLRDGHLVVVPTADIINRNFRSFPSCNAPLADLYDRLWETRDYIETLMRAVELGDRALHVAGGWVGGIHRAEAIKADPSYAAQMAARGYGTAVKIAECNPRNKEIQTMTRFIPEIMRHFRKIVEIFKALGKGIQSLYKTGMTEIGNVCLQGSAVISPGKLT